MNIYWVKRSVEKISLLVRFSLVVLHVGLLMACDISSSGMEANVVSVESPITSFEIEEASTSSAAPTSQTEIPPSSTDGASQTALQANQEDATNGTQILVPENTTRRDAVDSLINHGSDGNGDSGVAASFWTCTNDVGSRSFRYRFSMGYDGIDGEEDVRVTEDTVGEKIEVGSGGVFGPSFQSWRKVSSQEVEIMPDQEEFSARNYTWTILEVNALLTRVKVQDSRGFEISCARIIEGSNSGEYCDYDLYRNCVTTSAGTQTGTSILVDSGILDTDLFVNGPLRTARNYWACEREIGLEPFRMKVGNLNIDSVGDVRVLEGSSGAENSLDLDWKSDSLKNIQFLSNFTQDEVIVWTLFGFDFSPNGLNFTASDARGFDFSCERKNESIDYSEFRPESSCFIVPERCD